MGHHAIGQNSNHNGDSNAFNNVLQALRSQPFKTAKAQQIDMWLQIAEGIASEYLQLSVATYRSAETSRLPDMGMS